MTDPLLVGLGALVGIGVPAVLGYLLVRLRFWPASAQLRVMAMMAMFAMFAAVVIPAPVRDWKGSAGMTVGTAWMIACAVLAMVLFVTSCVVSRREAWRAYQEERAHNGGVAPRRLWSVGAVAAAAFLAPWGLILGMSLVAAALMPNGWLDSLSDGLDPNNTELSIFVQRVLESASTGVMVGAWIVLATALALAVGAAIVQWARHRHADRVYADDLRLQEERDRRVLDGTQQPYGTLPTGADPAGALSFRVPAP